MSRIDSFMNRSPLNITVSRKVILFSDILAVNCIVGWNVLASSMKRSTSFLWQSQREKRHQCNVFILLAWYCVVELNVSLSPPWIYLQRTLLFLCPLRHHVLGDNFFYWTQMSSLLKSKQAFPLDSVWGSEDHCCGMSHMPCILFLFPPLVVYMCIC